MSAQLPDALYHAIFHATFQFIGLLTPDGVLIEANKTALDFGGLTDADVIGKPFWECRWWTISPETQAQLRQAIQHAARGAFIRYQVDVQGAGDNVATIDFSLTPLYDAVGNVVWLIPEGRNISDQVRAERERDLFFEMAHDLLSISGTDGFFRRLNPAWERTLGYRREELLALPAIELVHPDDRAATLHEMERLAQGQATRRFENRYRHKDGSYRWLVWTSIARVEEGLIYSVARDETERKTTEMLLSGVLNSSLDGIAALQAIRDEAGQIVDFEWLLVNPRAEMLLNRPAAELIGQRLIATLPANRDMGLFDSYVRVVETGIPADHTFLYEADGIRGWFQNTAVRLGDGFAVTFRDITAQREAEETRLALAAAQMGAWEIDLATQEVMRSTGTDQLFGFPPDNTRRTIADYLDRVHPDDRLNTRATFTNWSAIQADHPVEFRIVRPDGSNRWVTMRGMLLTDAEARPARMTGVLSDITARKQVEADLRASEERYRNLAEAMPQHVWHTDAEGRVLYVNQRWCLYTGQTETEAFTTAFTAVHPADTPHMWTAWNGALTTRSSYDVEFRVRRYDGAYRWFVSRAVPIQDGDGVVHGWVGANTDIEDRKRSEERAVRLQHVTAELARALTQAEVIDAVLTHGIGALEALAGSVLLLQADGATLDMGGQRGYPPPVVAAFSNVPVTLDSPATEAIRLRRSLFLTSAEIMRRYPHLAELQATMGGGSACVPLLLPDRVLGVLLLSFRADQGFSDGERAFLESLAGQCAHAIERARLYEAERTARAQAEEALHLRDQFLTIAAHELKTPLTSLMGNTELLARRMARAEALDERDTRIVRVIGEQITRLDQLISTMLDLTHLQAGELPLHPAPFDLAMLVRRAVEALRPTLNSHTLTLTGADAPLVVRGDALRLEYVVLHLLRNAVKYSPQGGLILVDLERQSDMVCLTVTDQGIGIPAKALSRIFERFYRAPNIDPLRGPSGMGAGLYLVKEIVTRHGGAVNTVSTEGKGSVFTIRLPLNGNPAPPQESPPPLPPGPLEA